MPSNEPILVYESAYDLGIGGKIWDSSLSLLQFLLDQDRWETQLHFPTDGVVLDLGSATGVLGYGLAKARPNLKVWNSDLPDIMRLLEQTASHLNLPNVHNIPYAWGDPCPKKCLNSDGMVDVLVMTDVIYDETCYAPLLASLRQIPARNVLIAHRHRNLTEFDFFDKLARDRQDFCHQEAKTMGE